MKNLILAAVAALSLTAAIVPAANAFVSGRPHNTYPVFADLRFFRGSAHCLSM